MKNIFLVGVIVLFGNVSLDAQYKSIEGFPKEHQDIIIKVAGALEKQNDHLVELQSTAIEIINASIFDKQDLPKQDYYEKFANGLTKSAYNLIKGKVVTAPQAKVVVEILENVYGLYKNKTEVDEQTEGAIEGNTIVDIVNTARAKAPENKFLEVVFVNNIAAEYKNMKTTESQEEYIEYLKPIMEEENYIFKQSEVSLETCVMLIQAIHDSKSNDGGLVLIESNWTGCTFSFDEWKEVHKPNFCTPKHISIKLQGLYGNKLMDTLNKLMNENNIESILDLDLDVYSKLRVKIDKCTFCEVGFHIPYNLRTRDLIPDEMTVQKLGFKKGFQIPSRSILPYSSAEDHPCDYSCGGLNADVYGAALVHAGLWFVRNKNIEEFKRFDVD